MIKKYMPFVVLVTSAIAAVTLLFFYQGEKKKVAASQESYTKLEEKYTAAVSKEQALLDPETANILNDFLEIYYNYNEESYYTRFEKLEAMTTKELLAALQGNDSPNLPELAADTDNQKGFFTKISNKLEESKSFLSLGDDFEFISLVSLYTETETLKYKSLTVAKIHLNNDKKVDSFEVLVNKPVEE
ncbi:hypothetical protein [Enterococcus sp. BWR-S5]|uniref:hypothetical protein n=1 Tax=Enterococcus sp. BWR-S5 TaxID=2787714 RepID=UPI001923A331|nr:hypothetical protein [Enterococcus sp. BWR-S5]MBL1227207.1 hypothetical protein [Enterococcus sp. BWR-S5]